MITLEISERFWSDERLDLLGKKIGTRAAMGFVVLFWKLAKTYWLRDRQHIPKDIYAEFDPERLLIKYEFAIETEKGVYAKGSQRRFRRTEANRENGKKGGRPKSAAPKTQTKPTVNPRVTHGLLTNDVRSDEGTVIKEIISLYCEFYKKRYGANPVFTGKNTGIIKRLLKDLGYKKLTMMLQVYLQMNDQWFLKRHHDLTTFEQSLQKIAVATQTGKDPDAKEDPFSFLYETKSKDLSL